MYFKVVKKRFDGYYSVCSNSEFPESFRVHYPIGEWAEPNEQGSCLFLFNDLLNAKAFRLNFTSTYLRDNSNYKIFYCEAEGFRAVKGELVLPCYIGEYWAAIKESAESAKNLLETIPKMRIPTGSFCADRIKLIREV